MRLSVGSPVGVAQPWDAEKKLPGAGGDSQRRLGKYLNSHDPGQGLAGVGAALNGDAQGGRTFLHSDQGGGGL